MSPYNLCPSQLGKRCKPKSGAHFLLTGFFTLLLLLWTFQSPVFNLTEFLIMVAAILTGSIFLWALSLWILWKIEKSIFLHSVTPYKELLHTETSRPSKKIHSPEKRNHHVAQMASLENGHQAAGSKKRVSRSF